MGRYLKNGSFDDDAFNADIERNKSLFSELCRLGICYDFGTEWWEYCAPKQVIWYKDLLELIVVQLSKKDADVENLRRTWPEVHRIREEGRDAFKSMDLKPEQLESLYKHLHDRWPVVQEIQNLYKGIQDRFSAEERIQILGRQAGIDMTMDVLNDLKQKLEYVTEIWNLGGQASVDMSLSYLHSMSNALCNIT
ncbi:hypothetical protein BDV06DRAFT_218407 [Aspergillus oleicola]